METAREKRVVRWLLPALWLFYAATSTGTLPADPETRYQVAEGLIFHGDLQVHGKALSTVEWNGRNYAVHFPGQSLLFLPFVFAFAALGGPPSSPDHAGRFAAALVLGPLFGSLTVVLFLRLLRTLGAGLRPALSGACLLAFATPLWVYAAQCSEEVILAALLAAGLLSVARAQIGPAILLAACGLCFRPGYIACTLGLLAALWLVPRKEERKAPGPWLAAALVPLLLPLLYNWVRFGNPMETGYGLYLARFGGIFTTPFLTGLAGHLISPGKSIFLYCPLLLLLPWAAHRLPRYLAVGLAVAAGLHLAIYSCYTAWGGDWCWGVRYHTSLLPLLVLPIALWWPSLRTAARRWLLVVVLASAAVQVAGLLVDDSVEYFQDPHSMEMAPGKTAWTWEKSHFRLRFHNLATLAQGQTMIPDQALLPMNMSYVRLAASNTWNVFPFRARAVLGPGAPARALFALWLLLLGTSAAMFAFIAFEAKIIHEGQEGSQKRGRFPDSS